MAEGFHELLECPVCRARFARAGGSLRCAQGHSFDVARQGYVNMLSGGADPGTADTHEMVTARMAFFASGHYRSLIDAVATETARAAEGAAGCVIDAGAGTGEYLAAALDQAPGRTGLALDISKYAARVAARSHPRAGAVVCDIWRPLPVRDGVAAVVMSVFSPRNAPEIARVLAPGGALVIVTPTSLHLRELIGPLGMISVDPDKAARIGRTLEGLFTRETTRRFEQLVTLTVADAVALVSMGPSARHTTPDRVRAQADGLGEAIAATVSVDIAVWRLAVPDAG
ncbi:MAG: methyltransferase domain-containing protein [Coriobacteriia bacterium]|nr:methyltransferase domain-containing protein [Coriobacteriia bacterium]